MNLYKTIEEDLEKAIKEIEEAIELENSKFESDWAVTKKLEKVKSDLEGTLRVVNSRSLLEELKKKSL